MQNTVPKIHTAFKNYRKKLRHIWEEYSFIEFYEPFLHQQLKEGTLAPLEFTPFMAPERNIRKTSKSTSIDILGQVKRNSIKHRVLLDSLGTFEGYLCFLAETVYKDYPSKLKSNSGNEEGRDSKLINVILDYSDKEEMVSRIIEEKIRAIFYGNPANFFLKDKAKLEFRDYFQSERSDLIAEYSEIVARRNIIVHNEGRVDRKYLRETRDSSAQLGRKLPLDTLYLKRAMRVLEWLAALATEKTMRNIYGTEPRGMLQESLKNFSLFYDENV